MVKYIYFDDTEAAKGEHAKFFNDNKLGLETDYKTPFAFEDFYLKIKNQDLHMDGIIVDYRLDKDEKNGRLYTGITLAQTFREIISRKDDEFDVKEKKDVPIIIISSNPSFDEFDKEYTAKDLFDLIIPKKDLHLRNMPVTLISLSNGYKEIKKSIDNNLGAIATEEIFKIPKKEIYDLLTAILEEKYKNQPVHHFAQFILRKVLEVPGVLISENLLSAKLGIDIASKDWSKLCDDFFTEAKYTGVFYEFNPLFWQHRIRKWWKNEISSEPFDFLNADDRVSLIKEKTNLKNLNPLKPVIYKIGNNLEFKGSSRFNTVCVVTGLPIDYEDGIPILQEGKEEWMENLYVGKFCFDPNYRNEEQEEIFSSLQFDPSARLQVQSWKKEIDDAIK